MKKMKTLFLSVLLIFPLLTAVAQGRNPFPDKIDYVTVIGKDCTDYFNSAAPDFFLRQAIDNYNYPLFTWTSDKHTDARYPGYSNSPELSFFGVKVVEMIVRFEKDRLHQLYMVFYSRGDAKKPLSYSEFTKLRSTLEKALTAYTGDSGKQISGNLTENDRLFNRVYVKNGFVFELKSSVRTEQHKKSGEFIQLMISRFDPKDDPRRQSVIRTRTKVRRSALTGNINREDDGTVWLDNIPMVDQGRKGYCIPAVLERVLRYYGNEDVTQHTLAQLAGTKAKGGTSVEDMMDVVQKIGGRFGIRFTSSYMRGNNVDELVELVEDYNKAAKRMGKPEIRAVTTRQGNTICYMVSETLAQMEPEVEMKLWESRKRDFKQFMMYVRKNIGHGIPVIWSVKLGKFPEEKVTPQVTGGHMRLIIGYNDEEETIIYTDTWGNGHEKKSMSALQAWTITSSYFTVTPR